MKKRIALVMSFLIVFVGAVPAFAGPSVYLDSTPVGSGVPPFSQMESGGYVTYAKRDSGWELGIESSSPIQTVDNSISYCFVLDFSSIYVS